MKFIPTLLFASVAFAQNIVTAQTPAAAKTASGTRAAAISHAATPAAAARGCIKVPDLSPKIPALPAGAPCAKALYTLTTIPAIKVDYAAPQIAASLRESLGIEPTSFTLAYIDIKVGSGELAAPHKYYSIQYTGYLVDGTKFDSSYDRADHESFVFGVGQHQVIPGWDTGFAGMRVGGKRRLFIPYELAYGPQGHGSIPARAELIFDVELIKQSDQRPEIKTPPAAVAQPAAAPHQPAPKPATLPPAATGQPAAVPRALAPGSPAASAPSATPPAGTAPKPQ